MCIRDRYKSIFLNIFTDGAETWDMTRKTRKNLLATEMVYLRRSCRKSKLERVGNKTIRPVSYTHLDVYKRQIQT